MLICFVLVIITCGVVFAYQRQIIIPIGSKTITIDDQKKTIDTPAIIVKGKMMVGLRLIADIFGADILYDSKKKEATILFSNNEPKTKVLLVDDRRPSKYEYNDTNPINISSNTYILNTSKKYCRASLEIAFANKNGLVEYAINNSSGSNKPKTITPKESIDLTKEIFTSTIIYESNSQTVYISTRYRNVKILYIKIEESNFPNFPKE
jgi:hypothetical protein